MSDLQNNAGPRIPRYLDLLLCCLVAVLVCCLLHPGLQHVAGWLEDLTAAWPWSIRYPLFGLLAAGVWLPLVRMGGFRFSDLAWSSLADLHPPAWIAGILGCAFYTVCTRVEIDWPAVIVLVSGLACAGLYAVFQTPRGKQRAANPTTAPAATQATTFSSLMENEAAFLNWLEIETPIEQPQNDLFGMAAMARRIARILTHEPLKTIGIIGPYGCGKSSLVNLVGHYLDNPKLLVLARPVENKTGAPEPSHTSRLLRCRMDTWGVAPGALTEHVLQKIVDEMAKHVDVLPIRNLPENYRAAMNGAGSSWLSALCGFLGRGQDPEVLFARLDGILAATEHRLIIFIEDLDRNPDSERMWLEMAALLDRLHDLKNVTFILTIGQTIKASDVLVRVCEHIETFKMFKCHDVEIVVDRFRQICLDQENFIDLMEPDEREKRISETIWWNESYSGHLRSPLEEIASLMTTPRILKTALRRTWYAWKSLKGEVDLDDLLVTCVLRTGAPEAYAFIARNSVYLRKCNELNGEDKIKTINTLDKEWETIANGLSYNKKSAHVLVDFLFPGYEKNQFKPLSIAPQGVINSHPTDYWSRVNAETVESDEIHDQDGLHAIADWRTTSLALSYKNKTLIEAILTENGLDNKIEPLGNNFTIEEIRRLAHELFERIAFDATLQKRYSAFVNGFHQLRRMYISKHAEQGHDEWIIEELKKVLAVSLQFTNTLCRSWGSCFNNEKPHEGVLNSLYENSKLILESPEKLIISLRNGAEKNEQSIDNFMNCSGDRTVNACDWKWLMDVLFKACKLQPEIALPQVATIIMNKKEAVTFDSNNSRIKKEDYQLDSQKGENLFGDNFGAVLQALCDFNPNTIHDESVKPLLLAAKQCAADFLAKPQGTI